MKEDEMNPNIKLEIAVEIIARKIANASKEGLTTDDEEMQKLLREREKMYTGDKETIDKIVNVYGPEIKKKFEEG